MEIRPGKAVVRVARFGQSGDGFAGQTEIDEFEGIFAREMAHEHGDVIHVLAAVCDAVPEKDDPMRTREEAAWKSFCGRRGLRGCRRRT
jgi:hypothetical protein